MTISRSNSQTRFGPPAPNYIPPTPPTPDAPGYVPPTPAQAKARALAQKRLENGFVREAVKPHGKASLRRLAVLGNERNIAVHFPSREKKSDETLHPPQDVFAFALTTGEKTRICKETGATENELAAFRNLLSGKSFDLAQVQSFAQKWDSLMPLDDDSEMHSLPGFAEITQRCAAICSANQRINFVHSKVDFKTEVLNPEYDLGALVKPEEQGSGPKPEVAGILNPASRSGWGKSGASKAIQDGARGTAFQGKQKALYQRQTNLVGNAPVGQAYVVPVSDDKVVFSVAGPNHKHHTGLRIKLPRLSHLLKPGHVSKSQESKLRAAYCTFFASVDQYNADAGLTGKDAIKKLHMVPISANVFGFPKDKAASIMAEEILRYTAQNPDIGIQVLAVNDDVLAGHVNTALGSVGARCTTEAGVPKQA